MKSMNGKKLKLAAATAGTAGLLAMGGLTIAVSGTSAAEPEPGAPAAPTATTGVTVTEGVPATTPLTEFAKPSIEGPAPLPAEDQGLPG